MFIYVKNKNQTTNQKGKKKKQTLIFEAKHQTNKNV